jgi:hypothetical protein
VVEEHEVEMTDAEPPVEHAEPSTDDAEMPVNLAATSLEDAEVHGAEAQPPVEPAEPPTDDAEMPVDAATSAAAADMRIETVERVATGHDEIDAAIRRLDELDALPVDQHGEILDELHGRLRDALAAAASPPSGRSDD